MQYRFGIGEDPFGSKCICWLATLAERLIGHDVTRRNHGMELDPKAKMAPMQCLILREFVAQEEPPEPAPGDEPPELLPFELVYLDRVHWSTEYPAKADVIEATGDEEYKFPDDMPDEGRVYLETVQWSGGRELMESIRDRMECSNAFGTRWPQYE